MSADNPAKPGTGADKPAPAAPDGGAHGDSAHGGGAHGDDPPKAEPRSPAQFARDVHRTRPRDDDPPAAAPRPGGRDTAAPGPPRDDSPGGGASGTRAVPSQDHGRKPVPAPETTQPGDQGTRRGNAPDGSGHQPTEPRSPAQFARDVLRSRPRDDDPPATASQDSTRGGSPGPQSAQTEPATRQRPNRETARERPDSETITKRQADGGSPRGDPPPPPQRPPSSDAAHNAVAAAGKDLSRPASAAPPGTGPPDLTLPAETADPQAPGQEQHATETADTVGQQAEAGHPILHITSEFHGQKLGMYTDGTNWVSEEAVRARAEKDGKNEQSKAPERDGITGFPQQRDLGDNTFGENPRAQLGDTCDRRSFGEKLLEEDSDPDETKLERLKNKYCREVGEINDGVKAEVNNIRNALTHPQPTGHAEVPVGHGPVATAYVGQDSASPDSVAQLVVVGGVLGIETYRWAQRKVNEMTGRHDASHG